MNDLKYQILEKINFLNYYHRKRMDGIKKKRWILIAFGLTLIFIGTLSKLQYFNYVIKKPAYFDFSLIGMGLFLILLSIWVITRKIHFIPTINLDILNAQELEKHFAEITEFENAELDRGARRIASSIATVFTIVLVYLIPSIAKYLKTGKVEIIRQSLTDEGFLLNAFIITNILVFGIADIIGSPMMPANYCREKEKISNKVVFSFLTDIDNSIINPIKNQ